MGIFLAFFETGRTGFRTETGVTAAFAAGSTGRQAAATKDFVTRFAAISATGTEGVPTAGTAPPAITAGCLLTDRAGVTLFARNRVTAVGTLETVPATQRDVSRTRVVRVQDLLDQQKEITDPSLRQSPADGDFAFPLTESVSLHVRMMDIIISGFCQGDDSVRLWLAELTPAEPDLKTAQIDAFQGDGRRLDDNFFFIPVNRDSLILGGECAEISINLAK